MMTYVLVDRTYTFQMVAVGSFKMLVIMNKLHDVTSRKTVNFTVLRKNMKSDNTVCMFL